MGEVCGVTPSPPNWGKKECNLGPLRRISSDFLSPILSEGGQTRERPLMKTPTEGLP